MKQASHKRTNSIWFYLYEAPRLITFRDIKFNGGFQGLEEGGDGELFNEHRVSVLQNEKVLEIAQQCKYT